MRWIKKKQPSVGDIRVISSYCLLPITIGDETRWLEKSYILQVYSETEELYSDTELDNLLDLNKSDIGIFPKFNIQQEDKLYPCWINQKFVDRDYFLKVKIKKSLI